MGGPDQMSSRPQDRSTRTPSPFISPRPEGPVVAHTSPGRTTIDVSTRPLGERASICHGRAGRSLAEIGSRSTPGANVPTSVPFTSNVTVSVVPLAMLRPGGGVGGGEADWPTAPQPMATIAPKAMRMTGNQLRPSIPVTPSCCHAVRGARACQPTRYSTVTDTLSVCW
jgi:hypothetical protein